jgi:hypothetical protein
VDGGVTGRGGVPTPVEITPRATGGVSPGEERL